MAHSVSCIRATNFIFDLHVPNNSPATARYKFLKRGHSQGHVTLIFSALVANSSRTAEGTDCKVGTQVKIYFFVRIHLSEICTLNSALYSIVILFYRPILLTWLEILGNLNTKCAITV